MQERGSNLKVRMFPLQDVNLPHISVRAIPLAIVCIDERLAGHSQLKSISLAIEESRWEVVNRSSLVLLLSSFRQSLE